MPELPDVEGFARYAARFAVGRDVQHVSAPTPDSVRNTSPQGLGRALKGRTFSNSERRGKWLLLHTDDAEGPTLLMHFGMTGSLQWTGDPGPPHEHDRVLFGLDGGRLTYRSQRRFGGVWLASDDVEVAEVTGELGPDAADLDRDDLTDLLADRRGGVKSALMDQQLIAGIGNELSDEILWRARLHPERAVNDIDDEEIDRLHQSLVEVIKTSMTRGRIPVEAGWLESVRGEDDPQCPRCGSPLDRLEVAGRTAYVCRAEQRR